MRGAIDYGEPISARQIIASQDSLMDYQNQTAQRLASGWGIQESLPEPDADLPRFEEAPPAPDMVHQPNHYARYVIEPVTFIGANKLPFDVGNVIKYLCRYDAKNGIEDLEKAKRYVEIVIERVKREARIANGERAETVWSEII